MAKQGLLWPLLTAAAFMAASASASATEPMPVPAAGVLATRANGSGAAYARFFSFGDSQIDTGNYFRYAADPGDCSRFPYGENFLIHRPTGRCSDGRLIVDLIAERLGLPYWPPYLAGKTAEDFRYGANFAVSSATALDQLFYKKKHLNISGITPYSLGVQIRWFKKVLATLGSTDHERREIMASSLFLVGQIGVDDYNQPFLQNKTMDFIGPLVPLVVRSIGQSIEALIKLGARTVYVPGLVPLGCVPHYLFMFRSSSAGDYDPATGCLRWLNRHAARHNALLGARLAALRRAHPGASVVYVDYYGDTLRVLASPARSGFDAGTALDACCGGGGPYNNAGDVTCAKPGFVLCADPPRFVSWDGRHNTEAMHKILVRGVLHGMSAAGRWTE